MIIICINDNNSVINSNYGRLQDLMFLFEIPMVTRKDFFEICRLFGHTSSNRLASPVIELPEKETLRKAYYFSCIRYLAS